MSQGLGKMFLSVTLLGLGLSGVVLGYEYRSLSADVGAQVVAEGNSGLMTNVGNARASREVGIRSISLGSSNLVIRQTSDCQEYFLSKEGDSAQASRLGVSAIGDPCIHTSEVASDDRSGSAIMLLWISVAKLWVGSGVPRSAIYGDHVVATLHNGSVIDVRCWTSVAVEVMKGTDDRPFAVLLVDMSWDQWDSPLHDDVLPAALLSVNEVGRFEFRQDDFQRAMAYSLNGDLEATGARADGSWEKIENMVRSQPVDNGLSEVAVGTAVLLVCLAQDERAKAILDGAAARNGGDLSDRSAGEWLEIILARAVHSPVFLEASGQK